MPLSLVKMKQSSNIVEQAISKLIKQSKNSKYHSTLEEYKKMKDEIFRLLKQEKKLIQRFDEKSKDLVLKQKDSII